MISFTVSFSFFVEYIKYIHDDWYDTDIFNFQHFMRENKWIQTSITGYKSLNFWTFIMNVWKYFITMNSSIFREQESDL